MGSSGWHSMRSQHTQRLSCDEQDLAQHLDLAQALVCSSDDKQSDAETEQRKPTKKAMVPEYETHDDEKLDPRGNDPTVQDDITSLAAAEDSTCVFLNCSSMMHCNV